jgi:hypothetical protein
VRGPLSYFEYFIGELKLRSRPLQFVAIHSPSKQFVLDNVSIMTSEKIVRTDPGIFFKQNFVHDFFKDLLHLEVILSSKIKESEILFEKPRTIWCEENQGAGIWILFQSVLYALDQLGMLRVIEQ